MKYQIIKILILGLCLFASAGLFAQHQSKLSAASRANVSGFLNDMPAQDEILGNEFIIGPDSSITWQSVANQMRDTILYTVNDYTEIAPIEAMVGNVVLVKGNGATYKVQNSGVLNFTTDEESVITMPGGRFAVLQGDNNALNTTWFYGTDNEILDKASIYAIATNNSKVNIGQDTLILVDSVLLRPGVSFIGTCIGCGDLGAGVDGTVIFANLNDADKPVFVVDSISANISNIGLRDVSIQATSPAKTAIQLIHPNDFDVTNLNIDGGASRHFTNGVMVSGAVDFNFENFTIQNSDVGVYFYLSNFPGTTTNIFKAWIKDCGIGLKVDSSAAVVTVEHSIFEDIDSSSVIVENDDFFAAYLYTEGISADQLSPAFNLGLKSGAPIQPVYSFDRCQIAVVSGQAADSATIKINYANALMVTGTIFVNNSQTLETSANTGSVTWMGNSERTATGRVQDLVGIYDTTKIVIIGNNVASASDQVNYINSINGELTLNSFSSSYAPRTDTPENVLWTDSNGKIRLSDIAYLRSEFVDIYDFGATKDVQADQSDYIDLALATGKNILVGHTAADTIWISRPIEPLSNTIIRINGTVILLPFSAITLGANVNDGVTSVTVPNSALFEVGQWVGISDDDSAVQGSANQTRRVGASVRITNIPNGTTLTVAEIDGNYTTAQNAYIGRLGNIVLLENDTNVVIQGNGVLDVNWTNQIDIEGIRATTPGNNREEVNSQCGISMEECDKITIEGVTVQNSGLHNISDIGSSNITIKDVKLFDAHDKNIVGQGAGTDWMISNIYIDGSIFEDGIIFYTGPENLNVDNVFIKNCNRYGIFINEPVLANVNFNNIRIENCKYQFAGESDNINISNVVLVAGDSTQHNFWFDGSQNLKINNTVIEGNNKSVSLVYGFNDCSDVNVTNFTVKDLVNANYALRVVGTGDNVNFVNGRLDNVARGHEVGASTTNTTFDNIDFTTVTINKGTQDTIRATYIKCEGLTVPNYIDADFHIGKEYYGNGKQLIVDNPYGGTDKLQPTIDSLYNNIEGVTPDGNYATSDLTATGNRSHVWTTYNQTETFTTGDFKIANSGSANALFLDGGTGNLGLGTSPSSKLHVTGGNFYLVGAASTNTLLLFGESLSAGGYSAMSWDFTNDVMQFGTETGGTSTLQLDESGYVGIGNNPTARFHVYENTSGTTLETGIRVQQAGAGDSKVGFKITSGADWAIGIDNSDSDKFKITPSEDLASGYFTMTTAGLTGIGTTSPDQLLHVEISDAVTNAVTYTNRRTHITSGTATTSFGVGTEYELENGSNANVIASTEEVVWSDATSGSEDATETLKLIRAGTLTTVRTTLSTGEVTFAGDASVPDEAYGSSWNGSLEVPTKNALWDKIEATKSHVELYNDKVSSIVQTVVANTPEQLHTLTLGLSNNFTETNDTMTYTGTSTKIFHLSCSFAWSNDTAPSVNLLYIYVNDVEIGKFYAEQAFTNANDFHEGATSGLLSLATGDQVTVYIESDSNSDIEVKHLNISLTEL